MVTISKLILRIFGWHTSGSLPPGIKKAVMIVAPHTSYWDFVIGKLTYWSSRTQIRILIKKESFRFPLGILLRWLGAIPVDRGKKNNNMVEQVIRVFSEHETLVVVITPEGTRSLVRQWKKGFYLIAMGAQVPIALAFIDYKNKNRWCRPDPGSHR